VKQHRPPPLRFAFALHLHQPVGNFDFVFQEHLDAVYRPLLAALFERGALPLTLHISGPLLDWLSSRAPAFLDEIGLKVADGHIELLASGRQEPILAALDPMDRVDQILAMRELLRSRFGVEAHGLWLTERVWEQDLAAELAKAGISYTLLDDRHFLGAGLERGDLERPFETESGGHALTVLPIDERLRYLIPFRPVTEIEAFFRKRHEEGTRAVVLGDDGEKFGGWPDTRVWVYDEGWLDDFLTTIETLRRDGILELTTTGAVAGDMGGGLVYPAPGSYREMEEWTLPRPAALRIDTLWTQSDKKMEPHLRGGLWKGFLRKYPEANRMHKAAQQLSRLCRERGNPAGAREAIERAQCNDAYWHGVFGGVYLPHLRGAVWRELARAEAMLRRDEDLSFDILDWDLDGAEELWIHSAQFSAIVSPQRGGAIEVLTCFADGINLVDVLSRRLEPYHAAADASATDDPPALDFPTRDPPVQPKTGIASVHDRAPVRPVPPDLDPWTLAVFQERWTGSERRAPLRFESIGPPRLAGDGLTVDLRGAETEVALQKRYRFQPDGSVEMSLRWSPDALSPGAFIYTSLAMASNAPLETDSETTVRERIVTLARSERGFERVDQGERVELGWPVEKGSATVGLPRRIR